MISQKDIDEARKKNLPALQEILIATPKFTKHNSMSEATNQWDQEI